MRNGRDATLRLVLRTVLVSGRVPGRGGRAAHAIVAGLWLGVLSEGRLRELDELYYSVDETYRTEAWNARGLFDWERAAMDGRFASGARIAVVGAGAGREVLALLEAGFDAIGYESHSGLRAYGAGFLAERGHPGRLRSAPRDAFPAIDGCDGVLIGWGVYSLIASARRRVDLLRAGASAGGPVVLSCFARPEHGRDLALSARLGRSVAAVVTPARRRDGRRGPAAIELGDTLAPNRVHVFTRAELEHEFADAGLSLEEYRVVGAAAQSTHYACAIGRPR